MWKNCWILKSTPELDVILKSARVALWVLTLHFFYAHSVTYSSALVFLRDDTNRILSCAFYICLQVPVFLLLKFYYNSIIIEGFIPSKRRCVTTTCLCHIRSCPSHSPQLTLHHPIHWSTDLPAWLTQTLSVSGSSLWTAGRWLRFAMFSNVFYLWIDLGNVCKCRLPIFGFCFQGDPLFLQTFAAALCYDWRFVVQGKAWHCVTARGLWKPSHNAIQSLSGLDFHSSI